MENTMYLFAALAVVLGFFLIRSVLSSTAAPATRNQVDGLMYTGHEDDDLAARRAGRKGGRA